MLETVPAARSRPGLIANAILFLPWPVDPTAGARRPSLADGSLPAETQLPSEEGLIERFKVSRTTVRKAIQNLVGRGHARRRDLDLVSEAGELTKEAAGIGQLAVPRIQNREVDNAQSTLTLSDSGEGGDGDAAERYRTGRGRRDCHLSRRHETAGHG